MKQESLQPQCGLETSISEGTIVKSLCPPDPSETAEAAYLGRLESFMAHLEECAKCCRVYEDTVAFVDAIRKSCDGIVRMVR